ncbi:MAG TPA: rhodanese-like domain-containing protein [Herpetosiphonaceae bacterium]
MVSHLSRAEVVRRRSASPAPILVEALDPLLYAAVHLPGAVNVPPDRVDALAPAVLPDKQAPIIVYCASRTCTGAHHVIERLLELGYSRVDHYQDGKQDWIAAGLPVERGA